MTDKERLEEIKNRHLQGIHSLFGTPWVLMSKENFDWFIEQAEQKQIYDRHNYNLMKTNYKLQQQNKRYREALKNIYELAEYNEYDNTLEQIVSEIEKALEGTE